MGVMTGDSAGADRSTKTTGPEIHDQSGPSREATSEAIRALKDATGVHSYMGTFDQKHFKQVLAGKSDVERAEIEKGFSAFGKNLEEVIREKLSGTEQKEALNLLKHKNGDITSRRVEELDLVLSFRQKAERIVSLANISGAFLPAAPMSKSSRWMHCTGRITTVSRF